MNGKLFGQAVAKFLAGALLVALLLFVPAGTIRWRNGWLLMGLLFVPVFLAGVVMMAKSPELLRKRLVDRKAMGMTSREEAERFVEFSDMRNVRTCLERSDGADLVLEMAGDGEFAVSGDSPCRID